LVYLSVLFPNSYIILFWGIDDGTHLKFGSVGLRTVVDILERTAVKPQYFGCPAHGLVTILTEIFQLYLEKIIVDAL
jgi:hypothetical protein